MGANTLAVEIFEDAAVGLPIHPCLALDDVVLDPVTGRDVVLEHHEHGFGIGRVFINDLGLTFGDFGEFTEIQGISLRENSDDGFQFNDFDLKCKLIFR